MVKLAWYYHMARGEGSRRKIIARRGAFHGSTVMAACISGLPAMHKSFNLPDCNVVHTTRPHFYRDGLPWRERSRISSSAYQGISKL